MHELSLARSLWAAGQLPLVGVQVAVGSLSHIDPQALQAGFALLTACPLVIRREAASSRCAACGHTEEVSFPWSPACSRCGGGITVTGGLEFRLESVAVLEEEPRLRSGG